MPGIVGIISDRPGADHRGDLERMLEAVRHDRSHPCGRHSDDRAGLHLGWTCHPGSYCDCLPIAGRPGGQLLFFLGEHFAPAAHPGEPAGARTIMDLVEQRGEQFVAQLNGWFAGVLLDPASGSVRLFNDRYGVQRLYVHEEDGALLFATEAKALLAARAGLRRLDRRGLGELLACGCVMHNHTLFAGVDLIPGGSCWEFQQGRLLRRGRYFDPQEWESLPVLPEEQVYEALEGMFAGVVERYLRPSLPLAVSLTGGLDTRMIMAQVARLGIDPPCYTFGGMYRDSSDVRIAREIARACGLRHQVVRLGGAYLTEFLGYAERSVGLSDGLMSACGGYELYLNEAARRIAPVRLTGNYGSEVLRSAGSFKPERPDTTLFAPEFRSCVEEGLGSWGEMARCHTLSFRVFRQAPWYGHGRLALEQTQVVLRTPFMDNDLVRLMFQAPETVRQKGEVPYRLLRGRRPDLLAIRTDRALPGSRPSVAARARHAAAEFLFKADYCYKSGMPQWLERIHFLMGPFTPERLLIGRHRFTHFRRWLRRELADVVREVLLDPRTLGRGYLDRAAVERMVSRHLRGDGNYTNEIDKALTLELIHRQFVDGHGPACR